MASVTATSPQFQMIGCLGKHGPYTFYRSIKAGDKTYSLSQFMPVKIWPDSPTLNIADIQLIWSDKAESFCSLKLYFLPENTPDGRLKQHGEDEVITLQDKVIIRASDLLSILVEESEWDWGFKTPSAASSTPLNTVLSKSFVKEQLGTDKLLHGSTALSGSSNIVVLSYQRYTRLRTILMRLEGSPEIVKWLSNPLVLALGSLNVGPNCRVLYAKESFDHPDLEDNEMFCNHQAPKLKGRKCRKTRKRNPSHGSLSNESVSSSNGSIGSFKENEHKSLNGVTIQPKLELNIKSESSPKNSDSGKRRGSNDNGNLQIIKTDQKIWTKSDSSGTKRNQRTNGLSAMEQSMLARMGDESDWDSKGKAQLLGPGLTELALKLERSNALQILPIRPSAVYNADADEDSDNHHIPKKMRKTEYPLNGSPLYQKTGPYDSRSLAVGPPGNVRNKKLSDEYSSAGPDKSPIKAHTVPIQISKLTRADINWKPLPIIGGSPCPYIPLDKICCDPYDVKRQVVQRPVELRSDIVDYSGRKSRQTKGADSRPSSSLVIKNCTSQEMVDLSSRSGSSCLKISSLNDMSIPSPISMNQMGVRLTSEVTLFPSKNLPSYPSSLDGVMQQHFANPRHSANHALSNSKATPEIDIQPWKPSSSSSASGSRTFTPGVKEQVTAKKQTKGAYDRSNHSAAAAQSQGSSKSSSSGSRDRKEPERSALAMPTQVQQNPYNMLPYLGKMDPTYLHFLANATPLFMPPPPPSFMAIPGAVEQFYKDFFLQAQGIPPAFPGWFPPGAGNERGPKS